ncbi:SF3a splicing factor complex subunit PRP9 ASCRUDRAFT_76551 [Ascoidea rubescens DSM 1968]|uniref:Matrin-type domain-containing protein n=1 Tax=Ascoidea rubescens DSM 1968 TaxID=1344418 RepID=A0A1D2VES1_9ASCO|nr:hypothetical protein ASCRUDRAFT_76551 [Ascoidea rubescens DSM 1968]ODV60020.1 hypothetical protein ASCRUDRAFT_76551 [Ascoidea rubescens DSM 1968]
MEINLINKNYLEEQRNALEELDRIQLEISNRIQRNPAVYVGSTQNIDHGVLNQNNKRPVKEVLLQQHEINSFIKRYKKNSLYLSNFYLKNSNDFPHHIDSEYEIDKLNHQISFISDPNYSFENFDLLYRNIQKNYLFNTHSQDGNHNLSLLFSMGSSNLSKKDLQNTNITKDIFKKNIAKSEIKKKSILSAFSSDLSLDSIFSLEENYGKYLDLIQFHEIFLNLPGLSNHFNDDERFSITYLKYLEFYYKVDKNTYNDYYKAINRHSHEYIDYINQLSDYLVKFIFKIKPLSNPDRIIKNLKSQFEEKWVKQINQNSYNSSSNDNGDNNNNNNNESDNKLFCKPCNKLFSKETVFNGHLNGKKHKKNVQKLKGSNNAQLNEIEKELCLEEFLINEITQLLERQRQDTKLNVERKQALTNKERFEEIEDLLKEDTVGDNELKLFDSDYLNEELLDKTNEDSESDEENVPNPLNLPLGFDGKPIPYWLWKLQGLDREFNCEICGNLKYKGRKAFEKHFMEARHTHGLKCLGIQKPSSVFKGITSIDEVSKLWSKIKYENRIKDSLKENTVEVEDEEGNVMTEKVYNDLKKQGLI